MKLYIFNISLIPFLFFLNQSAYTQGCIERKIDQYIFFEKAALYNISSARNAIKELNPSLEGIVYISNHAPANSLFLVSIKFSNDSVVSDGLKGVLTTTNSDLKIKKIKKSKIRVIRKKLSTFSLSNEFIGCLGVNPHKDFDMIIQYSHGVISGGYLSNFTELNSFATSGNKWHQILRILRQIEW